MLNAQTLGRPRINAKTFRRTTFFLLSSFALVLFCAAIFFYAITDVVSRTQTDVSQIGTHSERVVAYTDQALSDLGNREVHEADYLIAPGDQNVAAAEAASRDAAHANSELSATQNIALSPAEKDLVGKANAALVEYSMRWGQLDTLHQANDTLGAVAVFRYMTDLMRSDVSGPLNQLVNLNKASLQATYDNQGIGQIFVLLAGITLVAALLRLQLGISNRMRRTFTTPLLVATVLVIGFTGLTVLELNRAEHAMQRAVTTDFGSIQAMSHLRVEAYAAKADRSRYISDTELSQKYDQAFSQEAAILVHNKDNQLLSPTEFAQALAQAKNGQITFQGDLATELADANTPEERGAALAAMDHWGKYLQIDAQIRQLESTGHHDQAVALALGNNPGQSNYEFAQFDQAVGQVITLKQDQFDADLGQVLGDIGNFQVFVGIVALLVIVLTWLGISPRLAEYR